MLTLFLHLFSTDFKREDIGSKTEKIVTLNQVEARVQWGSRGEAFEDLIVLLQIECHLYVQGSNLDSRKLKG